MASDDPVVASDDWEGIPVELLFRKCHEVELDMSIRKGLQDSARAVAEAEAWRAEVLYQQGCSEWLAGLRAAMLAPADSPEETVAVIISYVTGLRSIPLWMPVPRRQ